MHLLICKRHIGRPDIRHTTPQHGLRPMNQDRARQFAGASPIPLCVAQGSLLERVRPNRNLACNGDDPLLEKCRTEQVPTIRGRIVEDLEPATAPLAVAEACASLAKQRGALCRPSRREDANLPREQRRSVIGTPWRVPQRIRAVMETAVAMGLRPDIVCDRIGLALCSQRDVVRHLWTLRQGASNLQPVVKQTFVFAGADDDTLPGRPPPALEGKRSGQECVTRGVHWNSAGCDPEAFPALPRPLHRLSRRDGQVCWTGLHANGFTSSCFGGGSA